MRLRTQLANRAGEPVPEGQARGARHGRGRGASAAAAGDPLRGGAAAGGTAANNLALGLGLALLALLGILPLSRRMTRHLASLTEGAQRLATGDLNVRVPVPHGREFRHLAETFNLLARDLRRNQERLLEQERLRKELEIGRRIQEELLPRGPLLGPFAEVGGISIPAREVGGDFFNYFPLREDELAILVGDVSGKGVGAALLMASLQATIRARLGAERDLARLVGALDLEMGSEEPLAPYYTLFLALLEGGTGRLRYVNASDLPALLAHVDAAVRGHRGPVEAADDATMVALRFSSSGTIAGSRA